MADRARDRSLDGGGPLLFFEQDPPPSCGHGLCVETRFDESTAIDEVKLALRRAERHQGGPAQVYDAPVFALASLATGRCSPCDAEAESLMVHYPWLQDALAARLDWLRDRARRVRAQRDRTSCFAVLKRAEPGIMVPHDELFPADWNLLFQHEGQHYWAVDLYCPNPTCSCQDILVLLHDLDSRLSHPANIGRLSIDLRAARPRPTASTPLAEQLFARLWARHEQELRRRFDEVRRAVRQYAAARATTAVRRSTPGRNDPCSCGSGKKYKRCCADRDALAARAIAASSTRSNS